VMEKFSCLASIQLLPGINLLPAVYPAFCPASTSCQLAITPCHQSVCHQSRVLSTPCAINVCAIKVCAINACAINVCAVKAVCRSCRLASTPCAISPCAIKVGVTLKAVVRSGGGGRLWTRWQAKIWR
jgi:hypothetical protein